MPRDDLSIDAHFDNMAPGVVPEQNDPMSVLDDFVNRASNLPAEIQFLQEETADKDRQIQVCMDVINSRDASIQKWIRTNGSLTPNPKEAVLRKQIIENFDKAQILQEEKCALALKTQQTLDRHIRNFDLQILSLQERGEFPADSDMPSLLRPAAEPPVNRPNLSTASLAQAQLPPPSANGGPSRPAAQPLGAQRLGSAQLQGQQGISHISSSAPATPAAALLLQRQSRESSAGAANKRQRTTGGLGTLPANSSGLARHASTGPGTPKAGTPSATRAGSVGPRGGPKAPAVGKKVAPHKQGIAPHKSKPGKSGLSRVKRTGNKNSPSSTNDSELSDAETGSLVDEDEVATPPPVKKHQGADEDLFEGEEDEGSDDKKYCLCQKVSFGDMVACDNDECPFEWFHWPCVGLKSEPVGTWICPVCTKNNKK